MLFNSVGSMFYLVCQWLTTVLVVQLSSYADAGNLSLAASITNVFYTISTFGIRIFQVSDIENKYSTSFYVTTRLVTCLASLVLCTGFVLLNASYSVEQMLCIIIYMAFRLSESFVDVLQGIQQKEQRMDYIAISFIIRGILLLSSFCLVLHFTGSLLLAITAMAVLTMLVVLLFDVFVSQSLSRFRIQLNLKALKEILLECLPLMLTSLLMNSVVSIPRYFLEQIEGNQILGIYSSVATPAVIMQTACTLIYNPLITVFSECYSKRDRKGYLSLFAKAILALTAVGAVIFIGAAIFGKWGLHLLFGDGILPYVYLLIPVLVTTMMIAITYYFNMLLTISRRLKSILVANVVSSLIALCVSYPLIRAFGMDGVNYTLYLSMGANILIMVCIWIIDQKKQFGSVQP
ncbi:polysaccharide biosynthesis protein [[Clostridium] methylpentosum DSM 5476]|uniref:Polysaccharide biosynthesis protein n=1 Tax=[Clostridium] methylpentosum DSM 5476 TaxID=537013 RepID=C0EAN8_9FIRM|nr:polysaccharide biosynthesis protein [[Clostridium] methylpentosum DSM 5476]MDY3989917.1 oligosaccharide flippase family protein [Massilioclostridium sp.]MEE1490986.1 oligosaccharide flippase family protein [Massilioclostridium sp.]